MRDRVTDFGKFLQVGGIMSKFSGIFIIIGGIPWHFRVNHPSRRRERLHYFKSFPTLRYNKRMIEIPKFE
ncbi:hypothetical protein [Peribacillus asahii]|uniref:hypothetical protein n=1 Tax=Peribacillus asahii TaxID=228899 RepID=UPI00115CE2D8|nr:hypothetical protein [Peribacillus asahii]